MDKNNIKETFQKWATGYSGFDGGNPNGKIWLCGIEWGGKAPKTSEEIINLFTEDDASKIPTGYDDHRINLRFDYNSRFIKMIAAMNNIDFKKVKEYNDKEKFFTKNSNYFKLNLSPFNFPGTDGKYWSSNHKDITGFENKREYENWVWKKRKDLFRRMVDEYDPKLIITVGKTKLNQFKKFFNFGNKNFERVEYKTDKRLSMLYSYDDIKNRLLVNVYFFSRGWLVSDKALKETGENLNILLDKYNINIAAK